MRDLMKIVNRVDLLDKFAAEVAKKRFEKVPYATWRKIAHLSVPYVGISYMIDKQVFKVYTLELTGIARETIGEFSIHDDSLGAYMDLHWDEITPVGGSMYDNTITVSSTSLNYDYNKYSSGGYANGSTAGNTVITDPYGSWSASSIVMKTPCDEDDVRRICKDIIDKNEKKEKDKMDTSNLFNFDFGPVSSNQFRMSPYGIAVRTQANGWVAFNAKSGELFDVDILNFDISKLIYKMPVALGAVKPGDILMHSSKPVFVRSINSDGTVSVIDYTNATVTNILPVKSPFGFNFFTKVCALFNFDQVNANPDNPFGSMLPFLMLSGEKDGNFDPTLLFLAGGMGNMDFSSNPMMLYFLMNRQDKGDLLPFMLMMNGGMIGMGTGSTASPVVTSAPAST